jgi:hypothetical protein
VFIALHTDIQKVYKWYDTCKIFGKRFMKGRCIWEIFLSI